MTSATHSIRLLLVALVIPLLITLAALAFTFSSASSLPATVAVHWNAAGTPNGFGSPYTFPILLAVICLPLDAIFGGIAVLSSHRSPITTMTKILSVVGLFVSVLLAITLGGVTVLQHGADSKAHVPLVALPIGAGAAVVLSVAAWFLLPKATRVSRGDETGVAPVELAAGERASWIRSAVAPPALTWGVVGFMILITAILLFSVVARHSSAWPIVFIPVLIFLIVLVNLAWTVRVDSRGVRMRSALGVPTFTVPIGDISSADVIEVQALAQYGGFGVRWGFNGRFGVILRSGEALEVVRRSGRSMVVTVDDATTAAGLINGLVKQAGATLS